MPAISPADLVALDNACALDAGAEAVSREVAEMALKFADHWVNIKKEYLSMRYCRFGAIQLMEGCMRSIEEHHKNDKIANTAGSTAGVIGGLMVVGGLCAAPFTAGTSLAVTGAGAAMAGAGAATNIGADLLSQRFINGDGGTVGSRLVEDRLHFDNFAFAVECMNKYYAEVTLRTPPKDGKKPREELANLAMGVGKFSSKLVSMGLGAKNLVGAVNALSKYGTASIGLGKVSMSALDKLALGHMGMGLKIGISIGSTTAKAMVALSGVLAVVGVVFDGINLFNNIKSLVENQPNEATIRLRGMREDMKTQLESAQEFMEDALPVFPIQAYSNGQYLSHDEKYLVDLWRSLGSNQKFFIHHVKGRVYIVETWSYSSRGPFLSHDENAKVDLWCEGGTNQRWVIEEAGSDAFFLKTEARADRGPYLSNDGKSTVDLWTQGGDNQRWKIPGFALAH